MVTLSTASNQLPRVAPQVASSYDAVSSRSPLWFVLHISAPSPSAAARISAVSSRVAGYLEERKKERVVRLRKHRQASAESSHTFVVLQEVAAHDVLLRAAVRENTDARDWRKGLRARVRVLRNDVPPRKLALHVLSLLR